jgi:hypothetical protein
MMARHRLDLDGLAAKRVRHIDRLPRRNGDAVAVMTDMIDGEAFNHAVRR